MKKLSWVRFFKGMLALGAALVAALSFTLLPSTATALSIVDLTVSNVDLGVPGPYGSVKWNVSGGTASFEVDAFESVLNTGGGTNFGIDKFYFNTTQDTSLFTFSLAGGWTDNDVKNADGFGRFMIEVKGHPRQGPLKFQITGVPLAATDDDFFILSTGMAGNGPGHFAMHVRGFDPALKDQTSAFFRDGPSIPDPCTVFLLGSACLIGLVRFRKKFNK